MNTINIVSYNPETKLAEATISIAPAKDAEASTRFLKAEEIFGAFQKVLILALQARLQACFTQLMKYQGSVTRVTEQGIEYTQKGITRHYSFCAALAMKSAIEKLQKQDYHFDGMEANQMLKALVWCDDRSDKSNISFSILIDCLMEFAICVPQAEIHTENERLLQKNAEFAAEIESLKSRIKGYNADMVGTERTLAEKDAEIARLQGIINTVRNTCSSR